MAEAGLNAGCRVLEVERAWPQRKEGYEEHPHYFPLMRDEAVQCLLCSCPTISFSSEPSSPTSRFSLGARIGFRAAAIRIEKSASHQQYTDHE
jgi:hypothetical protein